MVSSQQSGFLRTYSVTMNFTLNLSKEQHDQKYVFKNMTLLFSKQEAVGKQDMEEEN